MSRSQPNREPGLLSRWTQRQRRRFDKALVKAVRESAVITMDDEDWNRIRETARKRANSSHKA